MKITLNNRPETLEGNSFSIRELLKVKNFTFKMLVIKINGTVVPKDKYDTTHVKDGDNVIVLHLVSGG